MEFTLLTYNLLYNKGADKIPQIVSKYHPDILCFQEITTQEENLKRIENLGYKIADYSNFMLKFGKIFGIATFYNPQKFSFKGATSFNLPRNVVDYLLYLIGKNHGPRIVLRTDFYPKSKDKKETKIILYNVHLTPYSTNKLRLKQMNNFLPDLPDRSKAPVVIAGDFNYPYKRKVLEETFKKHNLKEATHNIYTTYQTKFLKIVPINFKLDYVLYRNLELVATKRIEMFHSDHLPILSTFALSKREKIAL